MQGEKPVKQHRIPGRLHHGDALIAGLLARLPVFTGWRCQPLRPASSSALKTADRQELMSIAVTALARLQRRPYRRGGKRR